MALKSFGFADDVSLKSALSQPNRFGDKVLGLACNNVDMVFELLRLVNQDLDSRGSRSSNMEKGPENI